MGVWQVVEQDFSSLFAKFFAAFDNFSKFCYTFFFGCKIDLFLANLILNMVAQKLKEIASLDVVFQHISTFLEDSVVVLYGLRGL